MSGDGTPKGPGPSSRWEDPGAAPSSSRLPRGEFRPESVVNPPPKFLPVACRLPPERLFDAVLDAFRAAGVVIESLDRAEGLLRGSHPMPGAPSGASALVTAAVSPADDGGSRMLLSYDRPPGTRMDPLADGRRLEEILALVDAAVARPAE